MNRKNIFIMTGSLFITLFLTNPTWSQQPLDLDLNGDWVLSHEELLRAVEIWKAGTYYQDATGRYVPGRNPSGGGNTGPTITIPLPNLPAGAKPLEMVLIKAGTFPMGSPSNERLRESNETQHQVTLTQDFYLGKYEVTQAQWRAVMGTSPSSFKGDNRPVEQVSWNDCQTFLQKLNQMNQGTFRLPSEAEWEYACRAGTTTRFSFGDALECSDELYCDIMDKYMWWGGNNIYNGNVSGTKEVGLKLPNSWGLFDMHGNVWEWCQDRYGYYSSSAQTDPTGPNSGSYRVLRGGVWSSSAKQCRSAGRYSYNPYITYSVLGFRVYRTP